MRIVHRVISSISNGTVFGGSRIGRILGYILSVGVLVGFLYLMSI